jgi:hypothetical protein
MSRNKTRFSFHDPDGFQLYLTKCRIGRRKLGGATLMPHELLGKAMELQQIKDTALDETYPRVAEFLLTFAEEQLEIVDAQWRSWVSWLKESGSLESTLAVFDASSSMGSIQDYDKTNVNPIFPSIALSLILASVTKPPFNSGFITFSATPEFVHLNLLEQMNFSSMVKEITQTQSGSNVDLQTVFLNILLPLAKENNVTKENMVKRIIVFSDKQFDHAAGMITGPWWLNRTSESERADRWEARYSLIERSFEEAGYNVPQIVFWDLAGERALRQTVELETERRGVVMMSGFSNAMIKSFLGEDKAEMEVSTIAEPVEEVDEEMMTPMNLMKKALYVKSYDGLVVLG